MPAPRREGWTMLDLLEVKNVSKAYRAKAGEVKAKIIVFHGADDTFIPAEKVEDFKREMRDANVDMTFVSYPGVIHSFTNPDATELGKKFNLPLAYNADADKKSWEELKKFLAGVFKK
jgi:dienelactone hydrolase